MAVWRSDTREAEGACRDARFVAHDTVAGDGLEIGRRTNDIRDMIKGVRLVMGVLVAMTIALPAMGQETGQQCAAIVDDASRLSCYDEIFRTGAVEPTENLLFESEQLIPARPSGRATASFRLACVEGEPDVSFSFAGQQMSATGDITAITLQVDQGPTQVRTLLASEDNTAVRFGSARDSNAFLDTLAGGTTLKVRATPVRQRSLNVTFRIDEALPQITALRQSCNQAR